MGTNVKVMTDLTLNTCPKFKQKSEQVINTEKHLRVGWYCPKCRHFEKAILRETKWRLEDDKI